MRQITDQQADRLFLITLSMYECGYETRFVDIYGLSQSEVNKYRKEKSSLVNEAREILYGIKREDENSS
jgi:hypothetical protein